MKKDFRKVIKPKNDWFISLDYNGAEVRTVLSLLGKPQPQEDIHLWNIENVFKKLKNSRQPTRDEAKTLFFGWLYNPDSTIIESELYDRDFILDKYYKEGYVETIFGRHIKVEQRKAFNYLIQSITSDLVIDRAIEINKMLENTKSHISHIVHDELVIDLAHEDRPMLPAIKEAFSNNKLDSFMVNLKAGKNYYELEDLSL
jgi:DNA polymerase I-like protein with 3'-5' exonuclease and polymerase domains|tara:strand:+ start:31 stop:633 length:603 start_codon:yes stop_codon:yes gene_type:complete